MVDSDSQGTRQSVRNRRSYLKAVGGVASAGSLAGCFGGSGGSSGGSGGSNGSSSKTGSGGKDLSGQNVHFITVAATPSIKEFWKGVASDFESKSGAKMELEFVETSDISRLTQLIQAGDPPEVAQLGLTNTYLLYNRGVLEPLNSVYDDTVDQLGEPTETVRKVVQRDGNAVIAPIFHNINMYSYRSDLTDVVPETWDKAVEYARTVDEQESEMRGTYVPISGSVPDAVRLVSWLWPNEGSIAARNDDGKIVVNFHEEPYRSRMIELLKMLKTRQQYSPPGTGAGWADIMNIIQTGKAASSWYGGVRQKNAAIRNGRSFAGDIKLIPGMPTKRQDVVDGSTEGLVSFKGADTEAAKAFINHVMDAEFLSELLTKLSPIHNVPSWPGVKDSDAYTEGIRSLDLWSGWSDEQFENYQVEALSKMKSKTMDTDPPNPYAVTYYSDPIYNLQGDVLRSDKAPEDVIDQRAKELQSAVDDAQGG
ncbi:ABC transporter substrate-binding protein [Halobium palmae]|uniref:ABC transporter substrate-binding protein n=1 Tax=Halobium palmae TaxID=1776492 RepID=A0ABD5RWV0_9EURY